MKWVLILSAALATGCGGSGDDSGGNPDDDPGGGVVSPDATDVTGSFYLGSLTTPLKDAEIWLLDHTLGSISRYSLSRAGTVRIELGEFTEGHTYSFAVLKDWKLLGELDMSGESDGLQPAFLYEGGTGFSLGDVIVPTDGFGQLAGTDAGLPADLGGGFSLASNSSVSLNGFSRPDATRYVSAGSRLAVFDPADLLESFYRKPEGGDAYSGALARHSGLRIATSSAKPEAVNRVVVFDGPPYLKAAKAGSGDSAEKLPYWSETGFALTQNDDHFAESASWGGLPDSRDVLMVGIEPADGVMTLTPLVIGELIGYPPQVVSVSGNGGNPTEVDYDSSTALNGLTRPFCQSGNVIMDVAPPRSLDGEAFATPFNVILLSFSYYEAKGTAVNPLSPSTASYKSPYRKNVSEEIEGDIKRVWDPNRQEMAFWLGDSVLGAGINRVLIPASIFLGKIGKSAVRYIRLSVHYRRSPGAAEGVSVIWFDRGC